MYMLVFVTRSTNNVQFMKKMTHRVCDMSREQVSWISRDWKLGFSSGQRITYGSFVDCFSLCLPRRRDKTGEIANGIVKIVRIEPRLWR